MNRKCIIIINIFLLLLFSFTISIISSSAQNSVNPFSASPGRFVNIASGVSYKQGEAKYASISGFEHLISFSSVETFLEHASFSAENLHSSSELQNMDSPLSEGAYQWHTFYGSPNRDFGTEIAVDSAGGIVIIGDSDASWNGPGGQAPLHPHSGGEDIVVLKLDASGAYQWHTFYGSSSGEQVFGIAVDSAGGVVITGHSAASWDGPGGRTPLHPHSGGEDIVVLKLDASGSYQWHTFYGSSSGDYGEGIAVDGAGGIVITGFSDASWDGPGDQAPLHPHSGVLDIVVLKLDASGAYQWHTFYGSSYNDGGFAIAVDGAGGIVISGASVGSWNGPGGQAPLHPHSGGRDIVVLKLDASGAYQWHTFYGSSSSGDPGYGYVIAIDGAGGFVITGTSDASWDGPGGKTPLHSYSGGLDIVVLKLDASGDYQWHTFYGSSVTDYGFGIAVDRVGEIMISGASGASWDGPGGQTPLHSYSGGLDVVVLKLDASGDYKWHTFYGSRATDTGWGITVDGAGGIVITGWSFASWDGPDGQVPLHPYSGGADIVVLKLQGSITAHSIYLPMVVLQR